MHGLGSKDKGRIIDWGKTSEDYSLHRPGPPPSFYEKLCAHGIGLKDQKILDLGTGTGVLAREFAKNGAIVSGIDISEGQITAAQKLAEKENLNINFKVSGAEIIPFEDSSHEIATANQCWLYFDHQKTIKELRRVLGPTGILVTSHFSWLPRLDPIAKASEDLILKFNPQWSAKDWTGEVPEFPDWAQKDFTLKGMFVYDEGISFTREGWRGRMRACRGVGAALSEDEVQRFDEEHEELLKKIAPEKFKILHRIDAHILTIKS